MPLYSYKCRSCGNEKEEVNKIDERHTNAPSCCNEPMFIQIQPTLVTGCDSFNPHYDYQLGAHFNTKEEKQNFLKSKGFRQDSGSDSPRQSTNGRVIMSRSQAESGFKAKKL